MNLTEDCSGHSDESASYPQIKQPIPQLDEISTEHMIPLVSRAMQALKTCCELHYPECGKCQLNKELQLSIGCNESVCRCRAIPKQWVIE